MRDAQRVIITGASSGIGAALARRYARLGATLGLVARRKPEMAAIACLESLRVELKGSGVSVTAICPGYITTPMTAQNPYPMPFMLSADDAARKIIAIVGRGKSFAVIPWQMAIVARVLRVMPDWLYDNLAARAERKPRRGA